MVSLLFLPAQSGGLSHREQEEVTHTITVQRSCVLNEWGDEARAMAQWFRVCAALAEDWISSVAHN